jgi:DNA-binding MarR family transcriptional regulator
MSTTMDSTQRSLIVLKKFRVLFGAVRQHFREVEKNCGVTGSQLWILQEVANAAGIGVSELAGRLSIHQSTCSLLVDKLASRKLLVKVRSKADQRRVGLKLTKEAMQLIAAAPAPTSGVLPEALNALDAETIRDLDVSLQRLLERIQSRDERLSEEPLSSL